MEAGWRLGLWASGRRVAGGLLGQHAPGQLRAVWTQCPGPLGGLTGQGSKPAAWAHHALTRLPGLPGGAGRVARRFVHAEPMTPRPVNPRLVAFLLIMGTGLTALDVYYYLYVYEKPPAALSPEEFRPFRLLEVRPLTEDTSLLRFATNMPAAEAPLKLGSVSTGGIPIPSHVVVKDDSCQIARAYTPTAYGRRHFDLVVKRYEDGSVSRFLHGKQVGDLVEMRGPLPTLLYRPNLVETLGMVGLLKAAAVPAAAAVGHVHVQRLLTLLLLLLLHIIIIMNPTRSAGARASPPCTS
jgi:hypothetical protein